MLSKRQWQRCLTNTTEGKTLRESVNQELQSMDETVSGSGVRSLYVTRMDGVWNVCVNGKFQTGGFSGISDIFKMLSRVPIDWDDEYDPRRDG